MTWNNSDIVAQFIYKDNDKTYTFMFLTFFPNKVDVIIHKNDDIYYVAGLHRIENNILILRDDIVISDKAYLFINRILKLRVFT